MARMNGKRLGIGVVMGVSGILIAGGLFGLINTAIGESATTTAQTEIVPPTATQIEKCDYDQWLGKKRDEVEALVKTTGKTARIIHTGDPVTMDFSPDRINVELDQNDIVVKVTCG